jgi:hypothetical protein
MTSLKSGRHLVDKRYTVGSAEPAQGLGFVGEISDQFTQ